jgi:polyisoprenoid-binding protein YceI
MKFVLCSLAVASLAGLMASALTPSAGPVSAPADAYEIDSAHSFVVFHTKHINISEAYGRFNRISDKSEVTFDADPAKCSILVVVESDSVDTNVPDRDKHLRSGDFFSAKEFPEIVFESKKIAGSADKGWDVTGDLTFHGVTKSITAKARQAGKGDFQGTQKVGLVADFTINMPDFGIEILKKNPGVVGPQVAMTVSLECNKK